MKNLFGKPVFSIAFVLFCALITAAQDLDEVSIAGKVADVNGQNVAGAAVRAIHVETGTERSVVSNENGAYRLIELQPGVYTIRVEAAGFGIQEKVDVKTVAGQNVQMNFSLSPADIRAEQTVTVSEDDSPLIDTSRTVVGGTITTQQIEELPNNSRDPLNLVLTLGGTSEEALSTRDLAEDRNADPRGAPAEQGNFSLAGGVSYSNNLTVDGLDNNDDQSAGFRFQPSLEAIEEVQVVSNQFSAEYGRASGGRINIRTRSGGKKFRGRAFMFFRDDNLNANTWYNNSRAYPRLPLTEYNPGFTLSGPVKLPYLYDGSKRTFFSFTYEHTDLKDTTLIDTFVPVAPNPHFSMPSPTGSQRFCDNADPANCPALAGYISPFTLQIDTPNRRHIYMGRVDHKLFANNDITVAVQVGRSKNRRVRGAATTRIEDALQATNRDTEAMNFTDNWVLGERAVNQFRFQWSNYEPSFETDNPGAPVVLVGYRNPITNSTQTLIAGNSTSNSNSGFASTRIECRWQIQDSVSYTTDRHTFRGGLDIQRVDSNAISLAESTGTFNFRNVLEFSNNTLSRYRQNFGTAADINNTYWALYAEDSFRAARNLTITYGLRYERESVLDDKNNFGPRAALAWDPFKSGKTVIRLGGGIFYNRTLLRTVGDFIQNTGGNLHQFDTNNIGTGAGDTRRVAILGQIAQQFPNSFPDVQNLKQVISGLGLDPNLGFAPPEIFRTTDPNLRIPESYNFNIGFERQLGNGLVFEANYTSNKTAHLWREYNPNLPVLPSGYENWTGYLLANPFVFTNSNGSTRTYNFYLGAAGDSSGVRGNAPANPTATSCSIFNGGTCWVNLNTVNTTTTAPASAVSGSVNNATGSPLGLALAAVAHLRPNPNFEQMERVASLGNAHYNGLILSLRSRMRKLGGGFRSTMRIAYTLSKMQDDGLNNTSNAEINDDFSREWARSLQDRRHRIAISGSVDTPYWLGKLRFSPLFRFGSSSPFNLGYGYDRNLNDQSTDRLIYNGELKDLKWIKPGNVASDEFYSKFVLQPIGAKSGNLPRNAGIGPRQYIFDLGITREWRFKDRFRLRPNVEIGNVFNMAVFSFGAEYIDYFGMSANPTATQLANRRNFLVPTRTYRQRDVRVGLRFDF